MSNDTWYERMGMLTTDSLLDELERRVKADPVAGWATRQRERLKEMAEKLNPQLEG